MRVRVKICGITTPEDGLMAAQAGADAIGLVFWPGSPRCVALPAASAITRALPPLVLRVGVFVDASPSAIAEAVEAAGLDVVQLHGDEPPEVFDALPRRGIKAVRVRPGFDADGALRFEGRASGLLLDAYVKGAPGGTGEAFDWALAREVRRRVAFLVLAGGLAPDNVARAIREVHPDAVDVSTGVERAPGRKDKDKVQAFVDAVRSAA